LADPRGPPEELRLSPFAAADAVEPAGFRTVDIVELDPYHYGLVFRAD
jgi:hypothetical protein